MSEFEAMKEDELIQAIAAQGDLIKGLKGKKTPKDQLQQHVDKLVALKAELAKKVEASKGSKDRFDRSALEGLLLKRFFYAPSFAIYGGVAGLFDYGPPGTALLNNIISLWRRHFVLEEDMLEIECTNLTPESVFKTSGHVERFADYMVTDVKTGDIFRADHLVKQILNSRLDVDEQIRTGTFDKKTWPKGKAVPTQLEKKVKEDYELVLESLDNYQGDDLWKLMQRLEIKAPETGNDVTQPKLFNLMFDTQIGPTGQFRGEFTMAEIEHYVDPLKKDHPRFDSIRHVLLPLYPAKNQLEGSGPITMTIGEAVDKGIVNNQTLGYFVARIYLFLTKLGIKKERLRFRQHMANEMAHYACDCWDAEIHCSYGWIECVGCADRSAYDLSAHSRVTNEKLVVREELPEPKIWDHLVLELQKAKIGPTFKKDAQSVYAYFNTLMEADRTEEDAWDEKKLEELQGKLESGGGRTKVVAPDGKEFEITKDMVKIFRRTDKVFVREYTPNVIEPSFGLGRIMYCLLEHIFWTRDLGKATDENRHVLSFPTTVAPIRVLILPLSNKDEFNAYLRKLGDGLRERGVSTRVDASSTSIGRRYARNDELGTPFAITVDMQTPLDDTVTLRERDSLKQIRESVATVIDIVTSLVEERTTWEEVSAKYPAFVQQELDDAPAAVTASDASPAKKATVSWTTALPGTALFNNTISFWRRHSVLEDKLEIGCTGLTPKSVFNTSGHVERFTDYMRADLVQQVLNLRLYVDEQIRTGTMGIKALPKEKLVSTELE
ncbi:Glycine--tRNA ligase 1, mitochondrial [Irineochytrium annulatum]|nr:Glycine--tRNA ligase 1, mitochondrial [Irineochytrium annulatum]